MQISPRATAELVKSAPDYSPDKVVVFLLCETGKCDSGPAAKASAHLPNLVCAPTEITITTVKTDANGKIIGSATIVDQNRKGYFRFFQNGQPIGVDHPRRNAVPSLVVSR